MLSILLSRVVGVPGCLVACERSSSPQRESRQPAMAELTARLQGAALPTPFRKAAGNPSSQQPAACTQAFAAPSELLRQYGGNAIHVPHPARSVMRPLDMLKSLAPRRRSVSACASIHLAHPAHASKRKPSRHAWRPRGGARRRAELTLAVTCALHKLSHPRPGVLQEAPWALLTLPWPRGQHRGHSWGHGAPYRCPPCAQSRQCTL